MTGSEVGLLYGFLRFDDNEAPLYGRARGEVARFPREVAVEFLEAGFSEAGVRAGKEELEKAVDVFYGLPGWHALYGYKAACAREEGALEAALEEAVQTALGELKRLAAASELYVHVLRAVAMG